ncbi:PDZ domain-containing protein 8 [Homalodisca vitripennis]|nr:PDZ domain-containing protein 8 [Homalodisca vitripennis]
MATGEIHVNRSHTSPLPLSTRQWQRPTAMHLSLKGFLRTPETHHEAHQSTTSAVQQTAENNLSSPPGKILKMSLLDGCFKPEPAKALNSVLQFLFQECRNSNRVRRWFRARLSLELEELLTRTTTGKLFEAIALRELNLGTQFPNIDCIEIKHLNVNPTSGLIDDLELCLLLEYSGGFQLTIDANMRLNKTARVSVKVNELKGQGCLKFTRHPYTHWSFSFYSDPQLQLTVESQFQGRALTQINSIIASQIRKALKRKHTLPNYKLRYKPFFNKSEEGGVDDSPVVMLSGGLDVAVLQVSRVSETTGPVYCSLAVDQAYGFSAGKLSGGLYDIHRMKHISDTVTAKTPYHALYEPPLVWKCSVGRLCKGQSAADSHPPKETHPNHCKLIYKIVLKILDYQELPISSPPLIGEIKKSTFSDTEQEEIEDVQLPSFE